MDLKRTLMESPSQYVDLSSWGFRLWWFILLSVHLVTFGYNASNGLFYYELESTYLYACLIYSGIGMPAEAHHTIANVNIAMAGMHGVCVLLMMTGSLRHRKLVFYPWQQETGTNGLSNKPLGLKNRSTSSSRL